MDHVEQEPLVGLGRLAPEHLAVLEVELDDTELEVGSRDLGGQREREALVRLDADEQHVRLDPVGLAPEDHVGRPAKVDRDLAGSFGQALGGAQVERHRRPSPVVDQELERHVRFRAGVRRHAFLVAVRDDRTALHEAGSILRADRRVVDLPEIDRMDRGQDLVLLVVDRRGVERHWRLHRDEAEELEQVILHHVAQGTRLLVVRATRLHADGLGDRDLHVGDVVAVPQRLEDLVGEAQHEEVLDGLLPEIVIDAVDLVLAEVAPELPIEGPGALEVVAERLLDDDAGEASAALGQAGAPEVLDDVVVEARGRGAVEDAIGRPAPALLAVAQECLERGRERGVLRIARQVVDRLGKALPYVLGRRLHASVLADGLPHPAPEVVVGHLRAGHGHDGEGLG